VRFCCNLFYGCHDAREDASTELPDLIHKFWPIVVANPKSDILICTLQMLVSLTSSCPSGKYYADIHIQIFYCKLLLVVVVSSLLKYYQVIKLIKSHAG